MLNASLKQLAQMLADKKISSVELTQAFVSRIHQHNQFLNAFITVDPERSLEQARAADKRIAGGQTLPLTGIPIAWSDNFCVQGWRTTCGSQMLSDFIASYDAAVIERLNEAGAVILGKTNMDEFGMGSSGETSYYATVKNPWDEYAAPGGSSGGSACAVAARLAPAAMGTDTGGSVRQTAAFTGVSGIKPSFGLVSRHGIIAFATSLGQVGALAKSAEDLALLLNAMVGFDERDPISLEHTTEDYTRALTVPLSGLRIGLPKEYFGKGLSHEVARQVEGAIAEFRKLGAKTLEVSLSHSHLAIPVYYILASAEAAVNLSHYGMTDRPEASMHSRAQRFHAEVKRRILLGTYLQAEDHFEAYYRQAQRLRRLIAQDFTGAFQACDVLIGPATATTAFEIGEKSDDPVAMYRSDVYTVAANLAGLPALSIPVGFGEHDRPVGLQIIGNHFTEAKLLNVAHQYQLVTDWHRQMSEYVPLLAESA